MEYYILLGIQFLGTALLAAGSFLVLSNLNNKIKGALFFYLSMTMFNAGGYLGMMLSKTEGEAVLSQQIAYLGRIWVPVAALLFALLYSEVKFGRGKNILAVIIVIIHFATYVLVLTSDYHTLYYTNRRFVETGIFPHLEYDYGPWHMVYNVLLLVYSVIGVYVIVRKFISEKDPLRKKGTAIILIGDGSLILFFVLEIMGIGREYDMNQIGYIVTAVFFYIAVIRYDVLDTRKLARDFVIDKLSDVIVAVDTSGNIVYYNSPALTLFPWLATEMTGAAKRLAQYDSDDSIIESEGRKFRPRKNPLYRDRRLAGYTYVFSDETERIRNMEELEEQKMLADKANRAKSDFLARVSHDIRTPINAVIGLDEMILRESSEDHIQKYASEVMGAGKTLLALVNDMLDLSKIEEGKLEVIPTKFNIADQVNDLVVMVRDRIKEKGLDFFVEINGDIPSVLYGDVVRFKQCVMNLLTNAVKYTEKGSIKLSVDYRPADEGNITLLVSVRDTGIGIKPEDLPRIAEPFTRFDEERNKDIEGSGLGLSIVNRILNLKGSRLQVESEYGKGSRFFFELVLPVVDSTPVGDITRSEQHDRRKYEVLFTAPGAKVLVVDDNAVNLFVFTSLLKKTEVTIDTCASGPEGIEKVREQAYDVIFIDHMMPGMDGLETLKRMKEIDNGKDAVYVALTANAVSGAKEMYLDEGFADYLSKPIEPALLEETLMKLLPEKYVKREAKQ